MHVLRREWARTEPLDGAIQVKKQARKIRVLHDSLIIDKKRETIVPFNGTSKVAAVAKVRDGVYGPTFFIPWHSISGISFLGDGWTE